MDITFKTYDEMPNTLGLSNEDKLLLLQNNELGLVSLDTVINKINSTIEPSTKISESTEIAKYYIPLVQDQHIAFYCTTTLEDAILLGNNEIDSTSDKVLSTSLLIQSWLNNEKIAVYAVLGESTEDISNPGFSTDSPVVYQAILNGMSGEQLYDPTYMEIQYGVPYQGFLEIQGLVVYVGPVIHLKE